MNSWWSKKCDISYPIFDLCVFNSQSNFVDSLEIKFKAKLSKWLAFTKRICFFRYKYGRTHSSSSFQFIKWILDYHFWGLRSRLSSMDCNSSPGHTYFCALGLETESFRPLTTQEYMIEYRRVAGETWQNRGGGARGHPLTAYHPILGE